MLRKLKGEDHSVVLDVLSLAMTQVRLVSVSLLVNNTKSRFINDPLMWQLIEQALFGFLQIRISHNTDFVNRTHQDSKPRLQNSKQEL